MMDPSQQRKVPRETWVLAAIILAVNIPLLWGGTASAFAFSLADVGSGEWWRVVTYPLVHVSWYHLLMDAGAFLGLVACLSDQSFARRVFYMLACTFGCLGVVVLASPNVSEIGLSGLSGPAHGLMAVWSLLMMSARDKVRCVTGFGVFAVVVAKSICEAVTGSVVFSSMHIGDVGNPIGVCHAGGVLGGIVAVIILRLVHRRLRPGRTRGADSPTLRTHAPLGAALVR